MILKIVAIAIVLGAGVLAGSYLIGQPIIDIQGNAQNLWTFAQEHWLKLATATGGIVTGIGYVVSKVISRKNEAINTLGRTNTYLENQLDNKGEIEAFKAKYGEDAFTKIETLSTEVQTQKTEIDVKTHELEALVDEKEELLNIRVKLEREATHRNKVIADLKKQLGVARGEIPLVT